MTIQVGAWIRRATAIASSDAEAIASTDMAATVAETPRDGRLPGRRHRVGPGSAADQPGQQRMQSTWVDTRLTTGRLAGRCVLQQSVLVEVDDHLGVVDPVGERPDRTAPVGHRLMEAVDLEPAQYQRRQPGECRRRRPQGDPAAADQPHCRDHRGQAEQADVGMTTPPEADSREPRPDDDEHRRCEEQAGAERDPCERVAQPTGSLVAGRHDHEGREHHEQHGCRKGEVSNDEAEDREGGEDDDPATPDEGPGTTHRARRHAGHFLIRSKILKIGMYIAMIMPPTTPPRTMIMIGSIRAINCSVVASTSWS